jgi:hypothetical protein
MGTTSAGVSGSGSGLRAGGGSGWQSGAGIYTSAKGKMVPKPFNNSDIENEIRKTITALFSRTSPYIKEAFCNSYTIQLYNELFVFSQLLRKGDNIELICQRYDLDVKEPEFIFNLIDRLDKKFSKVNIDPRCTDTARATLENFLFQILEDNYDLAVIGNGKTVIKAMGTKIDFWRTLSGHFLLTLASTMFLKEVERKVPNATFFIKRAIEQRTNAVISDFKSFHKEGKVDYSKLLEYICENWEWFKREMTK